MHTRVFWLILIIACPGIMVGQSPMDKAVIDADVRKIYEANLKANTTKFTGNEDMMVRNGLVANRATKELRILSVATGNDGDLPLEYVLVGENGKAYESLAATLAKASDIHEAMEFIGMKAGHPIRPDVFQLWSKGDQVDITVSWMEKGTTKREYDIRKILKYPNAKSAIDAGWIFTGSYHVEQKGKKIYVANDTGDLISTFNSPWTVFDLSAGAGQKKVYGSVSPSDKYTAKHQQQIEFIIKPKLPKGETRNVDLVLSIVSPEGVTVKSGDDLRFTLSDPKKDTPIVEADKLIAILKALAKVVKNDKLVYATLDYDKNIPMVAMRDVSLVLQRMTDRGLLRIEPVKDQIFYQAFTPSESWRNPDVRPGQPLEFFLPKKSGDAIRFRYYDEEYLDTGQVVLSEMKRTFKTDEELGKILQLREDWLTQAVLFYAPPGTKVSDVQHLYDIVGKKYPIGFVFIEK